MLMRGALLLLLCVASVSAQQTISVSDANWFFTPLNWRHVTNDSTVGVEYMQTANPGSYFKVGFTGTSVSVVLDQTGVPTTAYMVLRYTVDEKPYEEVKLPYAAAAANMEEPVTRRYRRHRSHRVVARVNADALTAVPLASKLTAGNHTLFLVIRASSQGTDRWNTPVCRLRVTGLQVDSGAVTLAPKLAPRRMLVYWDSIGEGVRTINYTSAGDLYDNDATITWAYSLAGALKAELSLVAFGAQGYTKTGGGNVAPLINLQDPTKSAWSHYDASNSRLTNGLLVPEPDIIVNGHGTNDGTTDIVNLAVQWLYQIRTAAPEAHVLLTVPFGGYERAGLTSAYTQYVSATGGSDWRTHLMDMGADASVGLTPDVEWTPTTVAADGLHPYGWRSAQLGAIMAVQATQLMAQTPQ